MCSWKGWLFSGLVMVLCSTHHVSTLTCTKSGKVLLYVSSPRPSTDPFSNTDTLGPGCFPNPSSNYRLECDGVVKPSPILLDGVIGEELGPPNISTVNAWSRPPSAVAITFITSAIVQVRHIRLYFYNIPSMNIGLPEVILRTTIPQEYHVTGNQNLNYTDNRRRNVVLSYTRMVMTNTFEIIFEFTRTDVNWLLLSEVELCEYINGVSNLTSSPELVPAASVTRSSEELSSNLTLSCTVRGDGKFSWLWTGPQSPIMQWTSDFTRTSTALFTHIRGTSEGETKYTCQATYEPMIPVTGGGFQMHASQNFTIELQYSFKQISPIMRSVTKGESITLSCEVYGYTSSSPYITWSLVGTDTILGNDCIFTITTRNGNRLIQNGGLFPSPSFISDLTFSYNTFQSIQNYTCAFMTMQKIFTLIPTDAEITGSSVQCPANFTLSDNRNVAEIDVNTNMSVYFTIPFAPVVMCILNDIEMIYSIENYITELDDLVINNWTSVNLNHGDLNILKCDAGRFSIRKTFYVNFYSRTPAKLTLFETTEFYSEGENVSIVCRNLNKRPGFLGREVWTDSSGNVVGNNTLHFKATKEKSGRYTCSVPTVPAIPAVSYRVLLTIQATTPNPIPITATKSSVASTSQQNNTPTNSPSIITAVIIVVVFVMVALFVAIALVVVFLVCFQQKRKNAKPAVTASPVFDITTEMSDKISTQDNNYHAIGSNQNDSNEESDYATVDNNNQVNNNKPSPESPEVHKSSMNEDVQSNGEHIQDVGQLYAVVDKNAKKIAMKKKAGKSLDISGVYSVINNEADATIECEESELHDIAELYATVDKSAKKKISENQDLTQLYAVVDKSMKSKNIDA